MSCQLHRDLEDAVGLLAIADRDAAINYGETLSRAELMAFVQGLRLGLAGAVPRARA